MGKGSSTRVEANIFVLKNLEELSSGYRLYRIKGISTQHLEYYQNIQTIIRKLSYDLRNPVTVIHRDGKPYLIVRDDAPQALEPLYLVRSKVTFEPCSDRLELDYTERSEENDRICLRFLNFLLQSALRSKTGLWQPASGQPFFPRQADHVRGKVAQYRGFSVRADIAPNGALGLCVDIKHKYVSTSPLPPIISRNEFSKWNKQRCIYHYGHQWYQIRIAGLSDYSVSEHEFPLNGEWVSLLSFVIRESKKPLPPELANLSADSSVVLYYNNRGEERAAPTPLCYPTYGTEDNVTSRLHRRSILPPHLRRRLIGQFVERHLSNLRFGDTEIKVDTEPATVASKTFQVPDLKFGNDEKLTVRDTPGARQVASDQLGRARLALLYDREAGFFEQDPLLQQYLVLPETVANSYGARFIEDLCQAVTDLYPHKPSYSPSIITYDDRGPRTYLHQGRAILEAVNTESRPPGYAVVMVHHTSDRELREEDKLAALVTRELRPQIQSAIIHSEVGQECYKANWNGDEVLYAPHPKKRGKLTGYLRNVALSKVLLNNRHWPFVLATPLHADLTIGIDVKNNVFGIVVVDKRGERIWWEPKKSTQKERMSKRQLKSYLVDVLRKELQAYSALPKSIVLHRDGQSYTSEIEGADEALEQLKREGLLDRDASITVVEISKSAPVSFRFFEITERPNSRPWIENPQIGRYYIVNETDGYVCTTGRPFERPGTVKPLHIRRAEGTVSLENCLEDIFYLSNLTWTRPDDCTRLPITIKLNDILLGTEASEYSQEELEITSVLKEGMAANE